MTLVRRLSRRNLSGWRIAGFVLSNFLGLAIICAGVQLYADLRDLWQEDDSVVNTGYMVINKRVTASTMLGERSSGFSDRDISELERQPWVRSVGRFTTTGYEVRASLSQGGRGMSTMLFFESIPDRFVDVAAVDWHYEPGDPEVPIVIAKDYLALYNFGFAASAGLPKVSEQVMSVLPIGLRLVGDDGKTMSLNGRIVGYSDRLNTVLVPESFMAWSNSVMGGGGEAPTRLIIDVSSPGDVAIGEYLDAHGLEAAGDQRGSTASYLLKVGAGIVISIGAVITLLSVFILLLSMSLMLEKQRPTLHRLLMLGYSFGRVGRPYARTVVVSTVGSLFMAICAVAVLRGSYTGVLGALGAESSTLLVAVVAGLLVTIVTTGVNLWSVRRKVRGAWREG